MDIQTRSAFTRAKAMLLMALVVIIILRILSDEGFMRIKIGRKSYTEHGEGNSTMKSMESMKQGERKDSSHAGGGACLPKAGRSQG